MKYKKDFCRGGAPVPARILGFWGVLHQPAICCIRNYAKNPVSGKNRSSLRKMLTRRKLGFGPACVSPNRIGARSRTLKFPPKSANCCRMFFGSSIYRNFEQSRFLEILEDKSKPGGTLSWSITLSSSPALAPQV